jgi:hypothetical protein
MLQIVEREGGRGKLSFQCLRPFGPQTKSLKVKSRIASQEFLIKSQKAYLAILPTPSPENSTIPCWVSSGKLHSIRRHLKIVQQF